MAKFPANDIITLLDHSRPHNLAESTSADLPLAELLDGDMMARLKGLTLGYGPSLGSAPLRALLAEEAGVDPEDVIITPGAAAALFLSTFTICDPGDQIVVTNPNFPPTIDVMKAIGCQVAYLNLHFDSGYRVDLDKFRQALTPKTKLISVVTPNNPSGVVIPRHMLARMAAIVADVCPAAYFLVDETYREANYDDRQATPTAAALSPRTVVLASISKAHGAPGLRIGWLICPDRQLVQALQRAKMNVVISCSVVDEALALEVLRRKERILAQRRALLATALTKVAEWVAAHEHLIEWVRPHGGALCCVRLRREVFDDAGVARFHAQLPEHDAMVGRGPWFGEEDRVFRLGFGYLPPERLDAALAAVTGALQAAVR